MYIETEDDDGEDKDESFTKRLLRQDDLNWTRVGVVTVILIFILGFLFTVPYMETVRADWKRDAVTGATAGATVGFLAGGPKGAAAGALTGAAAGVIGGRIYDSIVGASEECEFQSEFAKNIIAASEREFNLTHAQQKNNMEKTDLVETYISALVEYAAVEQYEEGYSSFDYLQALERSDAIGDLTIDQWGMYHLYSELVNAINRHSREFEGDYSGMEMRYIESTGKSFTRTKDGGTSNQRIFVDSGTAIRQGEEYFQDKSLPIQHFSRYSDYIEIRDGDNNLVEFEYTDQAALLDEDEHPTTWAQSDGHLDLDDSGTFDYVQIKLDPDNDRGWERITVDLGTDIDNTYVTMSDGAIPYGGTFNPRSADMFFSGGQDSFDFQSFMKVEGEDKSSMNLLYSGYIEGDTYETGTKSYSESNWEYGVATDSWDIEAETSICEYIDFDRVGDMFEVMNEHQEKVRSILSTANTNAQVLFDQLEDGTQDPDAFVPPSTIFPDPYEMGEMSYEELDILLRTYLDQLNNTLDDSWEFNPEDMNITAETFQNIRVVAHIYDEDGNPTYGTEDTPIVMIPFAYLQNEKIEIGMNTANQSLQALNLGLATDEANSTLMADTTDWTAQVLDENLVLEYISIPKDTEYEVYYMEHYQESVEELELTVTSYDYALPEFFGEGITPYDISNFGDDLWDMVIEYWLPLAIGGLGILVMMLSNEAQQQQLGIVLIVAAIFIYVIQYAVDQLPSWLLLVERLVL